ncbi:MAG: histidine--tRNA ligase [Candidatus Omnitrophota bacterium]|nr:histidine--tRNA ligase [Candidatus Omnitrophota bacterium]
MAKKYAAFPGMDDLLPGDIEKWQWIEERARIFMEACGYKEIRTPLLEPTELFTRSIGEASDIVHKEMYTFEDRGGRSMTLRPEMTASVARAVIEKGLLSRAKSLRYYYIGPMFRAERPQAGRKRQFHQIGAEIVGEAGAAADFEIVQVLYRFLGYAGLNNVTLKINDLGQTSDRSKITARLSEYFTRQKEKLCKDCHYRLEKNVLRIFDCKVKSCQPVIEAAPWEEISPLGESFSELCARLEEHEIPYRVERRLVRGLDYYTGIVFEVAAEGLGSQDAVAGGGRYDDLYAELGGKPTPCTGFSIGVERLLLAAEAGDNGLSTQLRDHRVYLAPLETRPDVLGKCQAQALELRSRGFRVETTPGQSSLSHHLKRANQLGLRWVVILGAEELKKGVYLVKDLDHRKQSEVETSKLYSYLEGVASL